MSLDDDFVVVAGDDDAVHHDVDLDVVLAWILRVLVPGAVVRALLLLAFTSALRRSELAALDMADLESDPAGMIVHVARSKTDQDSQDAYVGIPYASRPRLCAVLAVAAWRDRLTTLAGTDPDELTEPLLRPIDRRAQRQPPREGVDGVDTPITKRAHNRRRAGHG